MKAVLILSYHFPPEGGPAVQRVLKFIKYLPGHGYLPVILTAAHPLRTKDPSLLAELPPGMPVHRVVDWAAWMPHFWRRRRAGRDFPDRHISWKRSAVRRAVRIVREEGIDLLFSSSPPHSAQLAAAEIAKRCGLPWIADLRDEWSQDPVYCRGAEKKHLETETRTLGACRAVVTVTPRAKENFRRILGGSVPVHFLPNGYDPADFREPKPRPGSGGRKLRILYSGRISAKHSPKAVFEILRDEFRRNPEWRERVEIRILGGSGNRNAIRGYGELGERVEFVPYRPHAECIRLMEEADVLLLLATTAAGSEIITGKVFEYMAAGKPIWAVLSHRGELSRILAGYGNAVTGFTSVPGSVAASWRRIASGWTSGRLNRPVRWPAVRRYDRKRQTAVLARIFDGVLRTED
jgi:glycosyltransferase involved in cell wall biosynthesis